MIEIGFSSSFKKSFKKRIKGKTTLENEFWERIELFKIDPFHDSLRTLKLSGKLKNLWSSKVDFETRVIFLFVDENHALFVDIGTHEDVY